MLLEQEHMSQTENQQIGIDLSFNEPIRKADCESDNSGIPGRSKEQIRMCIEQPLRAFEMEKKRQFKVFPNLSLRAFKVKYKREESIKNECQVPHVKIKVYSRHDN